MTAAILEEFPCIDVQECYRKRAARPLDRRELLRELLERQGKISLRFATTRPHPTLAIKYLGREEQFKVVFVPCNFGGFRIFCVCLGCRRHVRFLYAANGFFRCRRCHGLTHASASTTGPDRLLLRLQTRRLKLGGDSSLIGPFPPRPRRMRTKTYHRLLEEDRIDMLQHLANQRESLDRLELLLKMRHRDR